MEVNVLGCFIFYLVSFSLILFDIGIYCVNLNDFGFYIFDGKFFFKVFFKKIFEIDVLIFIIFKLCYIVFRKCFK